MRIDPHKIGHGDMLTGGQIVLTPPALFSAAATNAKATSRASTKENVPGGIPGSARRRESSVNWPAAVGPRSPGPCIQPGMTKDANISG